MRSAVPSSETCAMSRTLPLVGATADPPTVAPHAAIKCPGPSDPPAGMGAGVAPFKHEAGVFEVLVAMRLVAADVDPIVAGGVTIGVAAFPLQPTAASASAKYEKSARSPARPMLIVLILNHPPG